MIVGVDLDEVLANFVPCLLNFHNKKYGTDLTREQVHTYDLWKVWGGTIEEAIRKVREFYQSDEFRQILPVNGSQEGIDVLREKNELVVITSRPHDIKEETRAWLDQYFPGKFLQVYHTNDWAPAGSGKRKTEKPDICHNLGAGIFIEDNIEYAIACAEKGVRAFLLDCPWNQADSLPERVTRVKSWRELIEKLSV